MKKIVISSLIVSFVLFACKTEPAQPAEPELTEEQKWEAMDLELLNESDLYARMDLLEKKLINEESLEVSKKNSILMLEASKKHIEKFPNSENRREAIRKASKAAQGLQQDFEAVRLLEIGIEEFASDTTIVEEMNVRAFLYDKMDNKAKAKEAYNEIIKKFPKHYSVEMHKARLKTIDMNDEQLMEWLEKQNAK